MRTPLPNDAHVDRFIEMVEADFGVKLERAEALKMATNLVQLVYIIDHPGCFNEMQDATGGKGLETTVPTLNIARNQKQKRSRKRAAIDSAMDALRNS